MLKVPLFPESFVMSNWELPLTGLNLTKNGIVFESKFNSYSFPLFKYSIFLSPSFILRLAGIGLYKYTLT